MVVFGIVLSLLVLLLAGGFLCMLVAMRRFRWINPLNPKLLATSSWKRHMDAVFEGADWIKAHTAEIPSITSFDGLQLRARFCPAADARGTVILMHGFRSETCIDFSATAACYHALGYNLLLASQRAHGLSEGKYITYGLNERYDARDWAVYCAKRFGVAHPLVLSGVSMGAATVLMAASLPLPQSVRAVVADCGFTSAWDILRHVMRHRYHVPVFPLLYLMDGFSRLFAKCALHGQGGALESVAQTRLPILFIHGTDDRFVPCEMTLRSHAACAGEKELLLVEGAGHGVSFFANPDAYQQTLSTFLRQWTARE